MYILLPHLPNIDHNYYIWKSCDWFIFLDHIKNQNFLWGLADHKPCGYRLYEASKCIIRSLQKDLKMYIDRFTKNPTFYGNWLTVRLQWALYTIGTL